MRKLNPKIAALAKAASRRAQPIDEHAATELILYMANDPRFTVRSGERGPALAIAESLWRRMQRGTYKPELAPRAWLYAVNQAMTAYVREFGGSRSAWGPATRLAVARAVSADFEAYVRVEGWRPSKR